MKSPLPLLVKIGFPVAIAGLALIMYGQPFAGLFVYVVGFLMALAPERA